VWGSGKGALVGFGVVEDKELIAQAHWRECLSHGQKHDPPVRALGAIPLCRLSAVQLGIQCRSDQSCELLLFEWRLVVVDRSGTRARQAKGRSDDQSTGLHHSQV
jgi:hypothetical protein